MHSISLEFSVSPSTSSPFSFSPENGLDESCFSPSTARDGPPEDGHDAASLSPSTALDGSPDIVADAPGAIPDWLPSSAFGPPLCGLDVVPCNAFWPLPRALDALPGNAFGPPPAGLEALPGRPPPPHRVFGSCCAPVSLGGLSVRGRQRRRQRRGGHSRRRGGHSRRRGGHSRHHRRRFVGTSRGVSDGDCGDGALFLQTSGEGGGTGGGVKGRLN